jgi:nucleotide-binding universal stress UspA family protein
MHNLLAPIDFSDVSASVLTQAGRLARQFGAKLWLIHVAAPEPDFVGYEPGPDTVRRQVATRLHKEHCQLQALADEIRLDGIEVTPLLVQGQTLEKILEEAKRTAADLIVVGSHGHGALYRALVGGVCEGLLRKSTCPVLVVPAPGRSAVS